MSKFGPVVLLGLAVVVSGWSQDSAVTDQQNQAQTQSTRKRVRKHGKPEPSPGRQVANGTGNIAAGAGKGAGDLAKGAGKGAADLATLHPIDAAGSVGKGAVGAGKDVTVGTAKGTGKIVKGIGRGIKHIF